MGGGVERYRVRTDGDPSPPTSALPNRAPRPLNKPSRQIRLQLARIPLLPYESCPNLNGPLTSTKW